MAVFRKVLLLLQLSALLPGSVLAQRQTRPEFFRSFTAYDVSGSLSRVVMRQGPTILVDEHPASDLALISAHFPIGRVTGPSVELQILARALTRQLQSQMGRSGGIATSLVGRDRTSFFSILPSSEVRDGIRAQLELFRLEEPDFPPDQWVVERENREASLKSQPFDGDLAALAWSEAPRQASALATTSQEVRETHALYFRPGEVVFVVTGNVRSEEVLRAAADSWKEIPASRAAAEAAAEAKPAAGTTSEGSQEAPRAEAYRQFRGKSSLPVVVTGFSVPGPDSSDAPAIELLRYILAEGYGALLTLPREGDKGSSLTVESRYLNDRRGRLLVFLLFPRGDEIDKVETRLFAAIQALAQAGPPMLLLNRAKALWLTDHFSRMDSLQGRALELADLGSAGSLDRLDELVGRTCGLSVAEIRRVCRTFFGFEKAEVVEYLDPGAPERSFTTESFRESLGILVPSETVQEVGFLETYRPSSGEVVPFTIPPFEKSYSSTQLRKSSVLRGPDIYIREDHSIPLAHFAMFFAGGRMDENAGNAGITRILPEAMIRARTRLNGGLNVIQFEALGNRIEPVVEDDFFGLRVAALSYGAEETFLRIVEIVQGGVELQGIDLENAVRRSEVARGLECTLRLQVLDRGNASLFRDHPYGYPHPSCQEPAQITLEQLLDWEKSRIGEIFPAIMVSGDVSGTSFLQGLISRLSDPSYDKTAAKRLRAPEPVKRLFEEQLGNSRIAIAEGPRIDQDYVEILAVAQALLNGPGGRLEKTLREKQSPCSAEFRVESMVQGGRSILELTGPEDALEQAQKWCVQTILGLREGNTGPAEFRAALVRTITGFLVSQRDPERFFTTTMKVALADEPADYATRFILNIRQMRMGEVETGLQRFFGESP